MKSLVQFIKESLESQTLQNLEVKYDVGYNEPIVFRAPKTYSEDDALIYLQDKTFEEFPGAKKTSEKFFGANASKLIDAHFEYKTFQRDDDWDDNIDFDWDNKYDTKNYEEDELSIFVFDELKYILSFESFDIKSKSESDIPEDLKKIFEVTESSSINKYPLNLELSKDESFNYDF